MEMDLNEALDNISAACGPDGALDRIADALEEILAKLDRPCFLQYAARSAQSGCSLKALNARGERKA